MIRRELHGPLIVLECVGLQFFSLNRLEQCEELRKPSTFRVVYMLVMIAFLVLITFTMTQTNYFTFGQSVDAKSALEFLILNSIGVGLLLVVLISLIVSFRSTKRVKQFFINSESVAELMRREFEVTFNFEKIKRSAYRTSIFLTIAFLLIHITAAVFQYDSPSHMAAWGSGLIVVLFLFVTVYKFTFYVEAINAQLEELKHLLDAFFANDSVDTFEFQYVNMKHLKSLGSLESTTKKFRKLRDIYSLIHENSIIVNESNGLPMLILLSSMVVTLTYTGYLMFIYLVVVKAPSEDTGRESFCMKLLRILFRLFPSVELGYSISLSSCLLITTFYFCNQTTVLVSKIPTSIVNVELNHHRRLNPEMREVLQNFYLQTVHQPIRFTVFGLYTISLPLLASIITGIVSYQIILIQFYAT